jgi:ACDE family multidrug resistance protein
MSTAGVTPVHRGLARARASTPALYLVAALAYASFGTVFQVLPPFFDDLGRELGVGPTLTGLSMTAFLAPVALTSLLLGAAVDRHGSARVGRLGFALLAGGGAATAVAQSVGFLLAGRALAGLGGGMVLLATLKLLAIRVPGARLGRAFGIFVAGLPVGTGIAFDVLNRLSSWRLSAAAAATLVVPAGLAFTALVSPESEARPPRSLRADLAALRALPALRLLTLLVVLGYTAIIAFTTWAPTRLVAYGGLAPQTAALIASVLLLIDIPFAPLWGRVSDRVGRRKPFIVASFLVYGAGAFLVPTAARTGVVPLLLVVSAMGIGCAMFFPATLAIPQAIVPETLLGAAYGLFLTAQALGMTLGPLALGVVFDHAATAIGFLVIGVIAVAGLAVSFRLTAA